MTGKAVTSESDSKELINTTLLIVRAIEKRAKVFSRSALVLSIIDCLFGILAIFCTSLTVVAFVASTASLTTITVFGCVIQTSKLRSLEKALKPLNLVAIAWFVNKYKKYLKNKKGEQKVKTEKLSAIQIASIVGAVVGIIFAIVSVFVPQIAIAGESVYNILVATGIEGLCAFAGTFKGYKKLTEEQISAIKEKKEKKAQDALVKEAQKQIALEQKLANQTQAQKEKAAAKEEADKAKQAANAEHQAKVEEVKKQLLAEVNSKETNN